MDAPAAPCFDDIKAAAKRLEGHAVRTPLLESPLLNDRLGGRILVKAESLQRTGSFKYRGAFNRISLIPDADKDRGVVAYSSGNHAQGVAAAAARDLGLTATIVMPSDAPAIKRANTEAWGARVVAYDRWTEDREAIGARIAAETGAILVKPYDDPAIIAGQGTVGIELAEQAMAIAAIPDSVVVPGSGGGLAAGVALALASLLPSASIYVAEPEGYDDHARSLSAGYRIANEGHAPSFCDALLAPIPGELTFDINRRLLAGAFAVTDAEVAVAMRAALEAFKLVLEPGGAVPLAALLSGKLPVRGKTIAIVASGGNVDPSLFAEAIVDPAKPPDA